jgi:hypothetical protein
MTKRAEFALDTMATRLIATGNVAPVNVYDPNLPPGAPRLQERHDETGEPMWVADFLLDDEEDRATVIGVRFPAPHKPVFKKFERAQFSWLRCNVYVNGKTGQLGLNYTGMLAAATPQAKAA